MESLELLLSYVDLRTTLLCVSVFLLIYLTMRRPKNLPPGPTGIPILGCLPTLGITLYRSGLEIPQFFTRLAGKYGQIFSLQVGNKLVILLNNYDSIKEAFQNPHLCDRPPPPRINRREMPRLEPGVGIACGESWKQQRRFTLSTLRDFGIGKRSFEDQISIETKALINEFVLQQQKPFDPSVLISNAVSNIICSVVFGKRYEYSDKDFHQLLAALSQSFKLAGSGGLNMFIPMLKYFQPSRAKKVMGNMKMLRQFYLKSISEHRENFDPENLKDFIDAFLQETHVNSKPHVNEKTLVTTISNLFLAGTDTTTATLRWCLLYMIAYPDIQRSVHQEIDDIVGRNRLPRLSDISELSYTEATLLEIQRIATIAPLGVPHCAAEDTTLNGFNIPKGAILVSNLWAVHHDPEVWKDPLEFNPSRFLDQSGNVLNRQELIPFSLGRRVCLGENLAKMELLLFFTHLLHQFTFTKATDSTQLSFKGIAGLTSTPKPFEIMVTPRE